jgi:hypothetical protein
VIRAQLEQLVIQDPRDQPVLLAQLVLLEQQDRLAQLEQLVIQDPRDQPALPEQLEQPE